MGASGTGMGAFTNFSSKSELFPNLVLASSNMLVGLTNKELAFDD